ncbi:hypothetical protein [Nostoc sp. C117]|uniref:hypothetical protein n=1 Tax=Nostoc sp. C117 TaxID=3349875 RepID=UPI00370D77F9
MDIGHWAWAIGYGRRGMVGWWGDGVKFSPHLPSPSTQRCTELVVGAASRREVSSVPSPQSLIPSPNSQLSSPLKVDS